MSKERHREVHVLSIPRFLPVKVQNVCLIYTMQLSRGAGKVLKPRDQQGPPILEMEPSHTLGALTLDINLPEKDVTICCL